MTEESNTPELTSAPVTPPETEKVKSFRLTSTAPVVKPWLNFKIGFSFGFFAFLISPIILFQSVLFFLFLLVLEPTKEAAGAVGNMSFLLSIAQLLFFTILLFIAINLLVSIMGILFDKKRLWAIMALVLTTVSLLLIVIAPRLIAWQSKLVNLF